MPKIFSMTSSIHRFISNAQSAAASALHGVRLVNACDWRNQPYHSGQEEYEQSKMPEVNYSF